MSVNDVRHAPVAKPGVGELVGFVDYMVAAVAMAGVVTD